MKKRCKERQKNSVVIITRSKAIYKDPYGYDRKLSSLMRQIDDSNMPIQNKRILRRYKNDISLRAKPGFVYASIRILFQMLKDTRKGLYLLKESDIKRIYRRIMKMRKDTLESLSDYTKNDYFSRIKQFIKWSHGGKIPDYFSTLVVRKQLKKDKHMPLEDVKQFLQVCESPEERAFFSVLWEADLTVLELLQVRKNDITFENDIIFLSVHSKNRPREIPICKKKGKFYPLGSYHHLVGHLKNMKLKPSDTIWSFDKYHHMQYRTNKLRQKIGKPYIHLHSFRKSRATYNDSIGMGFYNVCTFGGWKPGSRTLQHYITSTGRSMLPVIEELNQ